MPLLFFILDTSAQTTYLLACNNHLFWFRTPLYTLLVSNHFLCLKLFTLSNLPKKRPHVKVDDGTINFPKNNPFICYKRRSYFQQDDPNFF